VEGILKCFWNTAICFVDTTAYIAKGECMLPIGAALFYTSEFLNSRD
jgi:hypothetical protein